MEFKPHKYQEFAIQKIIDTPACGLFLEMGLGKTVITLTALVKLKEEYFDVDRILIIAPKRVAEDTWPREVRKWDHLKHLKVSKVLGSRRERERALKAEADLYVINRENVSWLVSMVGKDWPFDTVVIDELSSFKSSKAQRFRALRRVRPMVQRVIGLTGTPTPNSLEDIWAQMYLLDQGERLGKTITGFRDRYLNPVRTDPGNPYIVYEWEAKPMAEETVYEKIGDIVVSMRSEDWLELPEKVDRVIQVGMSSDAWEKYKKLERDLLLPFDDGDVTASTAAVLSNKLLQMANGAVYDEGRKVRHIHNAKLDRLEDVVEATEGQPLLVFYTFQHDCERIKKRFKQARKLETAEDVADWNAGKISMLLAHPASAGHGLNLQDGGNHIVWFGMTWSLELYQQANARLYRQGQKKSVIIHHLVTQGTLDEDVVTRLDEKTEGQEALLEAVKARIRATKREAG